MSQIFKPLTSSGPIPPIIATSYVSQSGTAVPSANILLVDAYDVPENNFNGIETKGGVAGGDPPGTGATNEVDIYLTNRIVGTAQTTDAATPKILTSFALGAIPATYLLEIRIIAYNVTDALSAGYTSTSVIRTTGGAGSEITANPGIVGEEGAMTGVTVSNFIVGNTVETVVQGLVGKTINWRALTTYTMVT